MFNVGNKYSRKDIYKLLNVPEHQQGGNWDTGYNSYLNDLFIFSNVNTTGRTGHDYDNHFVGNDFVWYAKNRTHLRQPSIKRMLNPIGAIHIFVREDNNNPQFLYVGKGRPIKVFDESPVKIVWRFDEVQDSGQLEDDEMHYEGASK
ncbi:DUF3427 domain-containing protein [Cohnella luojiensis]|uniref:DUF3427 domain-containing protein n=1 Tax=Cohnella luojiensis TaxID=652876 RepID=UPI001F111E37|nr:DUF3427 domain-containing protein [Cohnella luojiensis]